MAVIQYKCTVCKREIDLIENRKGLEVMNRCVVTDGCRGELYRINRLQDFARGEFPSRVPGLTDFTQRRVLYNHVQPIASTQWFVTHSLGVAPSVQVTIETTTESEQEFLETSCALRTTEGNTTSTEITDFTVVITGPNTLTINFTDPRAGTAQMIARSSAPVVVETAIEDETPVFQLSNSSTFTIATLNSAIPQGAAITIDITYLPPGTTTSITKSYTDSVPPTADSPWIDFDTAIIQGKQYKVRSFDIFVSEMDDGTIPNGSSYYISSVNAAAPQIQEVLILTALSPFETIDKVTTQTIDVSRIDASNAELSFFYNNRDLFVVTPVITSVFPPIREV